MGVGIGTGHSRLASPPLGHTAVDPHSFHNHPTVLSISHLCHLFHRTPVTHPMSLISHSSHPSPSHLHLHPQVQESSSKWWDFSASSSAAAQSDSLVDLQNKKITLLIIDPQIDFHPPTAYYEVGGQGEGVEMDTPLTHPSHTPHILTHPHPTPPHPTHRPSLAETSTSLPSSPTTIPADLCAFKGPTRTPCASPA